MRRLAARLNLGQRIVAIVALAGALRVIGGFEISQFAAPGGGWFAYAPNTSRAFIPDQGGDLVAAAVVWLVLTVAWAGASMWLLGRPYEHPKSN